jgi:hypothetical protein
MSCRSARLWCVELKRLVGCLIVLGILFAAYLPTLQTIPNGADHYYLRDVGETQVVLNMWGTLHATGYPLYVILGNLLVAVFRMVGIAPATAPALVSLLWNVVALTLLYALAAHLIYSPPSGPLPLTWRGGGNILPAMVVTLLFGLTRTVWIHAVIAEIYSFGLAILALLYTLALRRGHFPDRIYWLALVGGIGVFHHRALILAAPALVYAVWPELAADRRKLIRTFLLCLLIGLLGFLPYLYLPIRAQTGANWVYGEPDTWAGFWDEFTGREAEQYLGLPDSWAGLAANFNTVNSVLVTDLTVPGIALGILGLLLALKEKRYRRAAATWLIGGLTAYMFHVVLYTDILSALILPMTLSMAFGWLFLADIAVHTRCRGRFETRPYNLLYVASILTVVVLGGVALIRQNLPFITEMTNNTTGLDTIALARNAPPGSTLMLAWGVRHHAVGFARDVLGKLPDIQLVDHKGDFAAIVAGGMLVTPEYTFYNHPVEWWEERLGTRVYLRAAAPYLVQVDTQPEITQRDVHTITALEHNVHCEADSIVLDVDWYTPMKPDRDLSVFVHLLDADGSVIAQADQFAPVYGWRPLTSWEAGEVVHDVYPLPRLADAETVRFGLYQQLESGAFANTLERVTQVECDD